MGFRINTNIEALNAQRNLSLTATMFAKSVERLSSGLRINRAGDDAAGLSISEKLRAQVRGLNQAIRNAQDGISMIQTAEGALNEVHSILQRMRELGIQAANETLSTEDLQAIGSELTALQNEIDRIAQTTNFNGTVLMNASKSLTLHIGSGTSVAEQLTVQLSNMQSSAIGSTDGGTTYLGDAVSAFTTGRTAADARALVDSIDQALKDVSTFRASLGAYQNRLEHTIANLGVASENLAASESRIRDVDMAAEMVNFTRAQILQQAGTAILAQANVAPQGVLSLLR
jgi:flagellin